jgi:hypothetical protein
MRTARQSLINWANSSGRKPSQPRPQANVGRVGRLGLHADQVLERLSSGQLPAAQQLASAGYRERLCNDFGHVEYWHPLATASGSVTIWPR